MWPFTRRPEPTSAAPGFQPREQVIFPYHDGTRARKGDPLYLLRELTSDPTTSLEIDYKLARTVECPETPAAYGRCVATARRVFGIPTLEAGGLTEANCMAVLEEFLLWVQAQKKSTQSGPTPATTIPASSPGGGSPTANTSASP